MGQSCSILNRKQVENNALLQELFGKEPIPLGEPFWNQFLSFHADVFVTKTIHRSLWHILEQKYGSQIIENYRSGNIVNLIANFIQYAKEIIAIYQSGDVDQGAGDIFIKQARNALLVLRFVIQCMTVTKNGGTGGLLLLEVECLPQHSLPRDDENESICVFDEFISQLLKILFNVPVNDVTLELHMEILLTCFVLLSCHVFSGIDVAVEDSSKPSSKKRPFLTAIKLHATQLTKYLVTNISHRHETPKTILHNTMSVTDDRPTSIMVASFDWLRNIFSSTENKIEESDDDMPPGGDMTACQVTKSDLSYALANHSLLMCIMLSCSDFSYLDSSENGNPFLNILSSFTDSEIQIASSPSSKGDVLPPFSIPVSNIATALSNSLSDGVGLRKRPSLVFLYLLLHRNASFKACALSRSDIDRLVVPLLRILYSYTSFDNEGIPLPEPTDTNAPVVTTPMGKDTRIPISAWQRDHAYLALICLLIFTEDDAFCRFANDLTLNSKALLSFYAEHGDASVLGNHPTLASLTLLVLLRAIRRNLLIGRDHYLHTSCLAALANLCAHCTDMHTVVASRLVDLLVALARRRVRLCAFLRTGLTTNPSVEETEAALSATDDTARLLLECVCCLTIGRRGPAANAHLIVSLLREQETIITAFRGVPNFQDLLQNIQFTMEYFTAYVERESSPPASPPISEITGKQHHNQAIGLTSVAEVLKVVKAAGSHFPVTRLRKMPDLKFHYVEESSASSHFFLPYALALYQRYGFIYWPVSHRASSEPPTAATIETQTITNDQIK